MADDDHSSLVVQLHTERLPGQIEGTLFVVRGADGISSSPGRAWSVLIRLPPKLECRGNLKAG